MKFEADILFDEFPAMFCEEFDKGHQSFSSWEEFLQLSQYFLHSSTLPKYVFAAYRKNGNVFVDCSNIIEIPWKELDSYR